MKKYVLFGLGFLLLGLSGFASYYFFFYEKSEQNTPEPVVSSQSPAAPADGVIDTLLGGQTNAAQAQTSEVAGASTETVQSRQLAIPSLPSGWTLSAESSTVSPCDPAITQKVTTYKQGSKTALVYENARPSGCDNSIVGDVFVSLEYTDQGFKATRQAAYTQCTKDQNPTCPKGDGKVTVFVGAVDEAGQDKKHPKTAVSYAFSLEDSSIGPDLNAQVNALLDVVDAITFVAAAP